MLSSRLISFIINNSPDVHLSPHKSPYGDYNSREFSVYSYLKNHGVELACRIDLFGNS